MDNQTWHTLGIIAAIALRDLFWWVAISTSLWIGRKVLNDKWGRIVFGRFWVTATSAAGESRR